MSYLTQSRMAQDFALIMRIAACVATESLSLNPTAWADTHRQRLVASPGWAAAYESALASENVSPGEDEAVITDGMILSAVQAHAAALAEAAPPDPQLPIA